jgi:hypothetical protein
MKETRYTRNSGCEHVCVVVTPASNNMIEYIALVLRSPWSLEFPEFDMIITTPGTALCPKTPQTILVEHGNILLVIKALPW